jgi:glycosyltransferase involved in cell wall biosynthesis
VYTATPMTLSIVIPAYNEERSIGPCLKSALRAAADAACDVQIVVVDNASTDRTAEIASRFPGVKVVHEPCKGLSRARQRGYLESRGELVANIDADCIIPKGYIAKVLREFEKERRLACFSGPFYYYDMPQTKQLAAAIFYLFQFFPNVLGQRVLGMGGVAQGGNFIIRRSMMDRIGGFNTSFDFYGEDTDISLRLARVGLVRFSLRLQMKTSGRRLLKEGVLRSGYLYTTNIIMMYFRGRIITKTHKDVRVP